MGGLTRPWYGVIECRRHRIEYEYVCNCTDPDWCDCDECPLCHEEDRDDD